jgi:hypothetical protein
MHMPSTGVLTNLQPVAPGSAIGASTHHPARPQACSSPLRRSAQLQHTVASYSGTAAYALHCGSVMTCELQQCHAQLLGAKSHTAKAVTPTQQGQQVQQGCLWRLRFSTLRSRQQPTGPSKPGLVICGWATKTDYLGPRHDAACNMPH